VLWIDWCGGFRRKKAGGLPCSVIKAIKADHTSALIKNIKKEDDYD